MRILNGIRRSRAHQKSRTNRNELLTPFQCFCNDAKTQHFDRPLQLAKTRHGTLGIKFKTFDSHKALVVEHTKYPYYKVRIFGMPTKSNILKPDGTVCFSKPIQPNTLNELVNHVDTWLKSFELIFGSQENTDAPIAPSRQINLDQISIDGVQDVSNIDSDNNTDITDENITSANPPLTHDGEYNPNINENKENNEV